MTHVAAQARVPKKGLMVFLTVAGVLLALGALSVVRGVAADRARVDIVSVVDGNTVIVNDGGTQRSVVLAGLVAAPRNPEGLSVGPEFCLGEESYVWLRDRLPQGAIATMHTSAEGAPDGMESAVFDLGGKTVNVDMATAGMAAPTGLGVSGSLERQISDGNGVARSKGQGLYDVEKKCTINHQLYEGTYALQQIPKDADATVDALDKRSAEYATALDKLRLVQEDVRGLDLQRRTFKDLAWAPARDEMLAKTDAAVDEGLKVLRDLNDKRNQLAARG